MSLDLSAVSAPLLQSLQEIEAFEQTPLEENFPHTDSYTMLQQSATRFGDDPALEFLLTGQRDESPRSVSYRLLGERINATANLLHSLGLQPDQAVSIVLPILPETHFAIWGAQAAGISDTEIVLGTHLDLSGPVAAGMPSIRNGMQMRLDEEGELPLFDEVATARLMSALGVELASSDTNDLSSAARASAGRSAAVSALPYCAQLNCDVGSILTAHAHNDTSSSQAVL